MPSPDPRRPWLGWYSTAEWRAKAAEQLRREPWCRFCARRRLRVPARVADHVDPHRGDPAKFWRGALQSLCKRCHSGLKQSLERTANRPGCGLDGLPTDPADPWSKPYPVKPPRMPEDGQGG